MTEVPEFYSFSKSCNSDMCERDITEFGASFCSKHRYLAACKHTDILRPSVVRSGYDFCETCSGYIKSNQQVEKVSSMITSRDCYVCNRVEVLIVPSAVNTRKLLCDTHYNEFHFSGNPIEKLEEWVNSRAIKGLPNMESGKGKGTKSDEGKADLSLLPKAGLDSAARAFMFGSKKYERDNWKKGISNERLIAALLRHLTAWNDGELVDSESGLSHLDHAGATLMMLQHFNKEI